MVNSFPGTSQITPVALPEFFGRYRGPVFRALQSAMPRDRKQDLYNMLRYHMGWVDEKGHPTNGTSGKALRPVLCLLACESSGGTVEQAMPAAVALELIHNFSLVHDDIQDGDKERHGRPTVWCAWSMPKALVAGNAMRVLADMALWGLLQEGVGYSKAVEASNLLVQGYMEMIEGQYMDLRFEDSIYTTVEDYLSLISLKTGALIRCSLELGALIGCQDTRVRSAFRLCGEHLGRAFQIRDDYLGVWGNEEMTGKAVGADILRKKKSFPVVYTLENARGEDKKTLLDIYSKAKLDRSDAARVLSIMEKVDAREHSDSMAQDSCGKALQALGDANLPASTREKFEQLSNFLLARKH